MFVKPKPICNGRREGRKPSRYKRGIGPICLHSSQKNGAARHKVNALFQNMADHRDIEALEQAHTFAKRAFEIQFAIHRAGGNLGHARANTRLGGQFINAFLADHGRIHIRQQHFLAPPLLGLQNHIHTFGLKAGPDVFEIGWRLRNGEFCCRVWVQPHCITAAQCIAEACHQFWFQMDCGIGD